MIEISESGDLSKTIKYLEKARDFRFALALNRFGKMGVSALASNTPIDSGKTASSWDYQLKTTASGATIVWTNSNTNQGAVIALLIQYGHGTGTGGYVQGKDYINPTMKPVFDRILTELEREVKNL